MEKASETRPENPFIGSGRKYISPEDAEKATMLKEIRELRRANEILKEALVFSPHAKRSRNKREIYEFIETKLPEYAMTEKCEILGVTKQGYYQWKKSQNKPYKYEILLAMIKAILAEHPENAENYGANRVFLRLSQPKYRLTVSYSTV